MKTIEINGTVKLFSEGIATSYAQMINIIANHDDMESFREIVKILHHISVVHYFFMWELTDTTFTLWQRKE